MRRKLAVMISAALLLTGAAEGVSLQGAAGVRETAHAAQAEQQNGTDVAAAGTQTTGLQTTGLQTTELQVEELLDENELYGWAEMPGEGRKRLTGGGNAQPVLIQGATGKEATPEETQRIAGEAARQFENLAFTNTPQVIFVSGILDSNSQWGMPVNNNKTIIGVDENATIEGGLRISESENIIISNLNIKGAYQDVGMEDAITIQASHHIWLNHLNVWNGRDGNLDIVMGSDYITVSWCKFWYTEDNTSDHRLCALISSGTDHEETDSEKLHVTYHHNWFADNILERMPRILFGKGHIYNNYYTAEDNHYCIGAGKYASVLIENNYFENVNHPHQAMYTESDPVNITARGNIYHNTAGAQDSGMLGSDHGYAEVFDNPPYAYMLDDAEAVPALVQANAGPQNVLTEATPAPSKDPLLLVQPKETEPAERPTPMPSPVPRRMDSDNPVTYDEATDTYTFHGQNGDGSNGFLEIENPFAAVGNYGDCAVAYWIYLPEGMRQNEASVLNFNLENRRQMHWLDMQKYYQCGTYMELLAMAGDEMADQWMEEMYGLGVSQTYVDAFGEEYQVLSDFGMEVTANPAYPEEGCYQKDVQGPILAYPKGEDPGQEENWIRISYIGKGIWEGYHACFDQEGGENSRIREAYISGSLSLASSGTIGFGSDDLTGLELNPNLKSFGKIENIMRDNKLRYWGNGSDYGYNLQTSNAKYPPTVTEKGQWHFVVMNISDYYVDMYVDGIQLDSSYFNYYGDSLDRYGMYGSLFANDITISDLVNDPDTRLFIGGAGFVSEELGQGYIGTPEGVQIRRLAFYDMEIPEETIQWDGILEQGTDWWGDPIKIRPISGTHSVPSGKEKPTATPTAAPTATPTPTPTATPTVTPTPIPTVTPVPSPTPSPEYDMGDADMDGKVTAEDALQVLRCVVKLDPVPTGLQRTLSDVDFDGDVTAEDALKILQYVVKLIDRFEPKG